MVNDALLGKEFKIKPKRKNKTKDKTKDKTKGFKSEHMHIVKRSDKYQPKTFEDLDQLISDEKYAKLITENQIREREGFKFAQKIQAEQDAALARKLQQEEQRKLQEGRDRKYAQSLRDEEYAKQIQLGQDAKYARKLQQKESKFAKRIQNEKKQGKTKKGK